MDFDREEVDGGVSRIREKEVEDSGRRGSGCGGDSGVGVELRIQIQKGIAYLGRERVSVSIGYRREWWFWVRKGR